MNLRAHVPANPYLLLASRFFIGGTFVFSAITKFPHHTQFEEIVKGYDLLPDMLATAYANTLPWVEIVIGVYLILGILVKPSAVATLLLGHSFMIANFSALAQGDDQCGSCFGETITLPTEQALILDILLMFAAAVLFLSAGRSLLSLDRLLLRSSSR